MAPSQSALNELLEAIRAGDGTDTLREAMRLVLQELIEVEASETIGAGRYERTEERRTHRNGSRSRLLSTKAGDVELHIEEAARGQLLPGPPGAAPAHRPGALGRDHGGLRPRGLDAQGR